MDFSGRNIWARFQSRSVCLSLASQVELVGLALLQVGLGLVKLVLVQGGVDIGQHCMGLDLRAVIDGLFGVVRVAAQVLDQAGHLGPDIDDLFRLDGARGADGGHHLTASHGRRAVFDRIGRGRVDINRKTAADDAGHQHQHQKITHGNPHRLTGRAYPQAPANPFNIVCRAQPYDGKNPGRPLDGTRKVWAARNCASLRAGFGFRPRCHALFARGCVGRTNLVKTAPLQ